VGTYLAALSSILKLDNDQERELEKSKVIKGPESVKNNKHFDRNRIEEPSDKTDEDNDANANDHGNDKVDDDDDDNVGGLSNNNENEADKDKPTVGVASTITGCGSDPFIDGAAVLKYSLDLQSRKAGSKFKFHTYVFYHPSAKECVLPLADLGYTLLERPTPVEVEEIGGDGGLRERIVDNGCCGEVRRIVLFAWKVVARSSSHFILAHRSIQSIATW
jgi:hypothetical protein